MTCPTCPTFDCASCPILELATPEVLPCPTDDLSPWEDAKIEIASLIFDASLPYVQNFFKEHGIIVSPEALVRIRQSAVLAASQAWGSQLSMYLLGFVSAFISIGFVKLVRWCVKPAISDAEPTLPIVSQTTGGGVRLHPNDLDGVREHRVRTHSTGAVTIA